jgi:hypothetical protein
VLNVKYLNNAPFSSQPANENFRNNYPFRDKFAEAVAAEKREEELQKRRVPVQVTCMHCNQIRGKFHTCMQDPTR